ncbi:MAG: amidohydrolase family protein [Actinomycetes bacterium]
MTGLVLANVRLPGKSAPCNVHIRQGRVSGISAATESRGSALVVNADGRFAVPGLWDEHVHMTQWALHANRIDLSGALTAHEAAAVVRCSMAAADPSVTTVGVGFRDALWPDQPSLAVLDAATGSQPTVLVSHDLHCVWLNSAAAARYAVQVDSSGLLREEPAFALTRELGRLPDTVVDRWVGDAARAAAARAADEDGAGGSA